MANSIQNIINNTLGDGAREAKFRCFIYLPNKNGSNQELDVLCKSSSFPGKSTETMEYKYKGKSIPIPGQEKHTQTWELTFYLEEDHKNRVFFDNWMSGMHYDNYSDAPNNYVKNLKNSSNQTRIVGNMGISQLNFEMDAEVCNYKLYNVFPVEISSVGTSSEAIGSMLEYTVTFSYSHYDIYSGDSTKNSFDLAEEIRNGIQGIVNDAIGSAVNMLKDTALVKSIDSAVGSLGTTIQTGVEKTTTSIKNFLG